MVRVPITERERSGRIPRRPGLGGKKEKLAVAALTLIIVGGIVALVHSIVANPTKGAAEAQAQFHLGCVLCGYEFDVSKQDFYAHLRSESTESSQMARFLCLKCKDSRQTAFVMSQCPYPDCQKWYFSNAVLRLAGKPTAEPVMCPNCKRNIMFGLKQYRAAKR
jgi:hypothetical protein